MIFFISVALGRSGSLLQDGLLVFLASARPFLDHVEDHGDEENSDQARGKHAADNGGAHDLTRNRPGAGRRPERDRTKDEGKRGHEDRAETQTRTF